MPVFSYLFNIEFTVTRVIRSQEGRPELHDILQVDPFTCVLLSKRRGKVGQLNGYESKRN